MSCYSMNPRQPPFNTIIIQPHFLQWIINQLPLIVITMASVMVCGIEGIAFSSVLYGIAVLLSLQLLYTFIYIRSMEYRITDQQIIFEHGVFRKSTDYMELYRVIDFTEHRSIMQQICALKTVTIYAGDRNMPRLHVIGVKNHYDFVSELRRRVIHSREIHHIYEITNRI